MNNTVSKHAERLDPDAYETDSVHIENGPGLDEFGIFDVRETTAHHAWVTALEDSFVSLEEVR